MLARQSKTKCDFFFRFICEFPFFTYVVGLNFRYELFIQKNTEEAGKMSERGVKR